MDSAPKKLDAVDKWRARVLFRDPLPGTDSWGKRMERQMAVLRVSFPFLTEKQLRGKAWTACGLRSLMGEVPRSGLSPRVKKEFMKQGKDIRSTMSPKLKIKKEPTASEKRESELSIYSCIFNNSGTEILIPQDKIIMNVPSQTLLNSLNPANLLPINDTGILSINSCESLKKRREKRKLKPKKVNFDTRENSSIINIVIPAHSSASWREAESGVKYKDPYCSQISKEQTVLEQSIDRYTPETISECSTVTQLEKSKNLSDLSVNLTSDHQHDPKPVQQSDILQQIQFSTPSANELQDSQKSIELLNTDSGSPLFECNLPPTPQNYWSKPILSNVVLYECTPIKSANTEDSTIIFKILEDARQIDGKSLENQQLTKSSSVYCMEKYEDSLSQHIRSDFFPNRVLIDGELIMKEDQNFNNANVSQREDSTHFILSQNYSLPLTPQEPLTNEPLLSNLCCEYSKACSKEEYKPVPYINCNNMVRKLKEDFDKIIPPEISLQKYFEAEEKRFEEIQSEVHKKVNNIILALEEGKLTETSKVDN